MEYKKERVTYRIWIYEPDKETGELVPGRKVTKRRLRYVWKGRTALYTAPPTPAGAAILDRRREQDR